VKRILTILILFFLLTGCKFFYKNFNFGSFKLINYSDKVVEFIWLAPKGDSFPVAASLNVGKNQSYESEELDEGIYDIAIDYKGEYNSLNSKQNQKNFLFIEKGITTVWYITPDGSIIMK